MRSRSPLSSRRLRTPRRLGEIALLLPAALAVALVGCSDDAGDASSSTGPTPGELAPPPDGAGVQLRMNWTIAPGTEVHTCRHYALPEGGRIDVSRLEHAYSTGGHHMIAYRTKLSAAEIDDEPFECGDIAGPFVYSEQFADGKSHYPPGVGMRFDGGEVLRLEMHFVNTTGEEAQADARLNLWYAEAPLEAEAGSLFLYDRDIVIPPMQKATMRMHCEIPEDIQLVYLLPHTHKRGTALRAWITGGDLAEPQPLLTSAGYGDLETRALEQEVAVAAGQAIDFECDYQNDSAETIVEGPSKENNEMCLILGGYYPRLDAPAEWCTLSGSGPLHDGAKSCGEALACTSTAKDAVAQEQCFFDVCQGSSRAINDVTNCGFNTCPAVCPGPECGACVVKSCPTEVAACQTATCD